MTTFPGAPRLLKGGLVLLDPVSRGVRSVIVLQYNPESLTRSLAVQEVASEGADRAAPLRLKGPPVETIQLEAAIDATDQLALGESAAARVGIHPHLAALESTIYPTIEQLLAGDRLADAGQLEIASMEAPLTVFVWSERRIVPVKVTDLSVTEEAFDPALNPIRAKVSLGLRVLSVTDVGFSHAGGTLFLAHQRQKEELAAMYRSPGLEALGVERLP